ncbi:energy-coupling factor ABC transporter ATP-binding protein [Clostridium sp. Cult2]|uniref:energy-coupling factor ABC transporter ATP-binding protein n=1 Tax=Clostridium sp. Cult2 TaxID=2079003 RepID=UPI001F20D064|nr:ABC transporter ATP-binding protein [Clostridium sp. Cult2]MCF6465524.1 ABC transporter ATP-binding protein [Clostridium sp. Cult2]
MINPIEIHNLYFKYNTNSDYILKGVDLTLFKGEILALVGLSGSGKSTLLNIMCGIIPHIRKGEINGEVKLWGKDIKNLKIADITKRVGIVFQDPDTQLFSPTVEDEIAFGPENLMVDREEIGERIKRVLKIVNMEDYRYENPNNLSGGQKQLIAIAAILAMESDILLLDEVLSQIDDEGKKKIKDVILNLKKEGRTIVLVEHDFNNLSLADRVLELKKGNLKEFKGW